jgi:hypothetical protein
MTICETVKAMMFNHDLSNYLWEKAISTTMYISNRFPHAILKDKTPEEFFSKIKPEVGNLYLDVLYIFMSLRKRGKRWNAQERKRFLWGTMRTPSLTGFMY